MFAKRFHTLLDILQAYAHGIRHFLLPLQIVGIGLCRTEHMFFEGEKIKAMREMILAENAEGRRKALSKILPYQQADFKGIFKAMEGCPVTVRLLPLQIVGNELEIGRASCRERV